MRDWAGVKPAAAVYRFHVPFVLRCRKWRQEREPLLMGIYKKLNIILISFIIIPLLLVGTLSFLKAREFLQKSQMAKVDAIVDLDVDRIESFFKERLGDIITAQNDLLIKTNFPMIIRRGDDRTTPFYVKAKDALAKRLEQIQQAYDYDDIILLDAKGSIRYSINHPEIYSGRRLHDPEGVAFEKGKNEIYISNVFSDPYETGRYIVVLTAPVHDRKGRFAGVIAFQMNMKLIHSFIGNITGLGMTGETLIVSRTDKGGLVFANPLRHDPDAILSKIVSFGERIAIPSQEAVQGRSGTGISIDYRGKEVVAAWRHVPSLNWGIVAKIDTEEAFKPAKTLAWITAIISVIVVFLAGLAATVTAKHISNPIHDLQKGTEIIGNGNLDCKVGTEKKDEIGQLSRAFDRMVDNLKLIMTSKDLYAEQLEAANKELESFSYSVSHDLRAPLRALSGFGELLVKSASGNLDEKGRHYLNVIIESAGQMGRLIDDLLSFSKMRRIEMAKTEVYLDRLVSDAQKELQQSTEGRDIVWEIGKLPQVCGDPAMLRLVFVNLMSNALKFTKPRSRTKIGIGTVLSDRSETVVYVSDNGVGFDMKYADKLFCLFQRLHRQDEFEGTGVGLANVRRIIQRHGGRTWAEGSLDGGATFYFSLPNKRKEV